jgi:potassium efflux system protein
MTFLFHYLPLRRALRATLFAAFVAVLCAAGLGAAAPPALAATAQVAAASTDAPGADTPDIDESNADSVLAAARQQLEKIQKTLQVDDDVPDATLVTLRQTALDTQAQAQNASTALAPLLANVAARLAELGPAPQGKAAEAPDVAAQRAALDKQNKQLDAQVKLAGLLSVEADQVIDQVAERRRSQFTARIGERTSSFLAAPFWQELNNSLPHDTALLRQMGTAVQGGIAATPVLVWAALAVAAAVVIALLLWAEKLLLRLTAEKVPPGRLRRSLLALALTTVAVAGPGLVAHLVRLGLTWSTTPPAELESFLVRLVGMVCFGGFVTGLGGALLAPDRPSWRLPPLGDRLATGLRRYPLWLALVMVAGWTLEQLAVLVHSSLATAVALDALATLALGLLVAAGLRRATRLHRENLAAAAQAEAVRDSNKDSKDNKPGKDGKDAKGGKDAKAHAPVPAPRPAQHLARLPWSTIATGAVWIVLGISLGSLLLGYVALGSFLVKQVVWIALVAAGVYLFNALLDDAFTAWLSPASSTAQALHDDATLRVRAQAGVLLSALSRLAVLLFALVLIAAPFGQGPLELMQRADQLRQGIAIGEIHLQPASVLQALLVFILGTMAVRLLQRWLRERYLPTTGLDAAMRDSATSLLGFVGTVAALAFALSAIGLGLERIAWVASALSVGIGFGLQAVVSNFVSGLILLAERPVKVGDWVSLSGVEGDIRRINVRATEIQMGDRSTVIVPNSEFITKIVRNVTLANPLGQVSFKLPMALDSDVQKVREIMLTAFAAHEGVQKDPAPSVFLESVETERIIFAANGTVASPRQSYAIKSDLLFEILDRLRDAGQFPAKPSAAPATAAAEAEPSALEQLTADPTRQTLDVPPPLAAGGPPPQQQGR